jgi:hypothetical protein
MHANLIQSILQFIPKILDCAGIPSAFAPKHHVSQQTVPLQDIVRYALVNFLPAQAESLQPIKRQR